MLISTYMLLAKVKKVLQKTSKVFHRPVNLGDLDREKPFSEVFGYDRGGPVDRYYIENYLRQHSHRITGRVLEIGDNDYTLKFGGNKVLRSEIFHVDGSNVKATFIGDLSDAPHVPDNSFDCIILTQTLHLIYHYQKAIETCFRILKPGGSLIITVPGISHIAQDKWGEYWFWSFTDKAINRILTEQFKSENIQIGTFGNVLAVTAYLYGMGRPELTIKQLDYHDSHYQLVIASVAIK